jgi:hypothetical protein
VTSPEILLASGGERYWLLRVDQKGGGVGTGVPAIEIGWVPQMLIFAARGNGPFLLAYGNSRAKASVFAIDSLIPGYKTDAEFRVKSATLGEPTTLAGAGALARANGLQKMGRLDGSTARRCGVGLDGVSIVPPSCERVAGLAARRRREIRRSYKT